MIYKIKGASDWEDSSMFNGMIKLFNYRQTNLSLFIKNSQYVRHPFGSVYSFSRDQYICLASGLSVENKNLVNEDFISGKDILSPSVKGHTKLCKGLKNNWLEKLWLKFDILFHSYVQPESESNQLICMMWMNDDSFLKLWVLLNKKWEKSIMLYWDSWRDEKEFGEFLVKKISERLNRKPYA